MYILVISDSHGRRGEIEKAIEAYPEVKHIFFLGDCVSDIEDFGYIYPDRSFHIVEGNCDGHTLYKSEDTIKLYGKTIFFTHGHPYYVKHSMEKLYAAAKARGADLVLYGHTHTAKTEYADGIYFVNPGSLYSGTLGYTSFGLVDITDKGIMPSIVRVK